MAVPIKVPSVGESISEGVIAQWLKNEGDFVREGEPLFELETEKASQEISSPASGVLHITAPAGKTVAIGQEVGQVDPQGKPNDKATTAPTQRDTPAPGKSQAAPAGQARPSPAPTTVPSRPAPDQVEPLPLAPSVRRLVAETGIDPRQVTGTGPHGRITREDVSNFLRQHPPIHGTYSAPPATAPTPTVFRPSLRPSVDGGETRRPMTALRQRIAERLVASQQETATLTTFNEADLSAVMEFRGRYKDRFKDKHGVGLGFMSFFVKACVEALKAFPIVNGRIEGSDIVTYNFYHIGVAVSTERGLMVPVVRDADRLSFAEIEQTIADLAARARAGKITVDDLQGGTFTITHGGIFGSLLSTPILNPPQSAILGMHTIQKRPVVVNDQVVIRPMMYLALSYDHRLIDGSEAVQFLVRIKECVENPERMMLEV
jgi:2-oxoglutarate dehydrogenase E2 component (dihydrolipoamide succinyltransferase)